MSFSRYLLSLLASLLFSFSISAQLLDHRQGELIVQLQETIDGKSWAAEQPAIEFFERLSIPLNIWLLRFDHSEHALMGMQDDLQKQKAVLSCQRNRLVKLRNTPNDALYGQQWQHRNIGQSGGLIDADFDTEFAWDVTTGGLTANGDTIVVCVIDNGVDTDHPDLMNQIWINRDEIPENGMDDDNNGYIDDVMGWDTRFENNDIDGGAHGTSVAGLIGAEGNNTIGVAGVNWNVQMMVVRSRFQTAESEVIQAYSYALEARMAYDSTGGAEGAYVVATNASWGLDRGQAEDSPIWCALYDVLGEEGILNVGATANLNLDVEQEGDLPTTCPSEYLIGVTNLRDDDMKRTDAAFGNISIDLGAYGENTFTTTINSNYGLFNGTSAATPNVTGAIALLYSAPCSAFGELLESDPAGAALFVKDAILNSVTANADLATITVTGGRLNINDAMMELMSFCDACLAPSSEALSLEGANAVRINWSTISSVDRVDLRYRSSGSSDWVTLSDVSPPYLLEGLSSCTSYEYQLLTDCTAASGSGPITSFITDGCCNLPLDLGIEILSPSAVALNWPAVLAATEYNLRYRIVGSGDWLETDALGGSLFLTNLQACSDYEIEIQTDCDTAITNFGLYQQFSTSGCGTCLDADYCQPPTLNNSSEWISEVNLGNLLDQLSEAEPLGYRNYGLGVEAPELVPGGVYPFSGQPAYSGTAFSEEFKIWIDLDQNGFFSSNEIVFEESAAGGEAARGDILIPENTPLGLTRMRIVMEFSNVNSACPVSTRTGEIEDYCVRIVESPGCVAPDRIWIDLTDDLVSVVNWTASAAPGGDYVLRYRLLGTSEWTTVEVSGNSFELDLSDQCAVFELQIASNCGGSTGAFSTAGFNSCTSTSEPEDHPVWSLAPNPADDFSQISVAAENPIEVLKLFDLNGRELASYQLNGVAQFRLPTSDLASGVYLIRLQTAGGREGVKRLLVR
ncbi:MAG: S8 family serine peptidase [Bacteroidota bacterium]